MHFPYFIIVENRHLFFSIKKITENQKKLFIISFNMYVLINYYYLLIVRSSLKYKMIFLIILESSSFQNLFMT